MGKNLKGFIALVLSLLVLMLGSCTTQTSTTPEKGSSSKTESELSSSSESSSEQSDDVQTVVIKDINSVAAGVSKNEPEINIESVDSLIVGNSDKDNIGLVRIPLPAAITSEDVVSAKIRLKVQEGDNPNINASPITVVWDRLGVNWNEIKDDIADYTTNDGTLSDGWYEIEITDIVKGWFDGKYPNYGVILQESGESTTSFYTPYSENEEDIPELVVEYNVPEITPNAAPFGYDAQDTGNCLSFALRDGDAIYADMLGIDMSVIKEYYDNEKYDDALEYVKDLVIKYVDENADSLKISSFRELSDFEEEIDAEKEYRIALRIGMNDDSFDFHLQSQIQDGAWTEKFGSSISRIVPGSNINLDPGLYPWDQNEFWGLDKWTAFYDSNTVYFAVTKDVPEITFHLQ